MTAQQLTIRIRVFLCEQFQLTPDQVTAMMPNFIATLSVHMANLERSLASGDPQTIGKAGHTIKGALLNLGLADYAELAFAIEKMGKGGDRSVDYKALVANLRSRIEPLLG
ncbi:Hpt domain-containing protein [Desulfoprunum benzoelyticum]|uniref:HPt (Histidine-containing phosphotransfer) domain-containing protein n=1 Tax=Desulfoprunum benzoelyticum TaxID=1506996 RepID=A0A840ULI7_9BACT|nr:Hpt domain-containing protein [Desulfoprunum benzoelyticum]MBB5346632.1 HPt (histidine-containing phosphotransfer) domain-containing protein [Desulfoprunum benzoelyticum]MBM9529122.1 Hpt domain-containing protein [Desulfoprunum benzoelyticum]